MESDARLSLGEIPSTVNPDLQKERNKATFNPTELTNLLDGGIEKTKQRKKIGKPR